VSASQANGGVVNCAYTVRGFDEQRTRCINPAGKAAQPAVVFHFLLEKNITAAQCGQFGGGKRCGNVIRQWPQRVDDGNEQFTSGEHATRAAFERYIITAGVAHIYADASHNVSGGLLPNCGFTQDASNLTATRNYDVVGPFHSCLQSAHLLDRLRNGVTDAHRCRAYCRFRGLGRAQNH
jgi:hypothetical protein